MNTARELTNHLAILLRKEKDAMADFLLALADFDRKRLWRELGHTSLFAFLRRELKLSAGAAQNRKTAVELIQRFPAVEAALRSGDLCLSTINAVAKVLTAENEREVLPRFFGLSYGEAEAVVAELRPAPVIPVRDVVVPVRAAAARTAALAPFASSMPESAAETHATAVHTYEPERSVRVDAPAPTEPVLVLAPTAPVKKESVRPEPVEGRTDGRALRDDV
ncbi:MAG TPA: DUF222 domain-containing protein, partial [Anaeromyxobacteraceae bacterium]|nr:DUF222 domain-containing protein [Anaeromyxobacteraceae bacterium]